MNPKPKVTTGTAHLSNWSGYLLAIGLTAAALIAHVLLAPAFGMVQPFAFFYLPVLLTAWRAGAGPAVVASVAGLLLGGFLFVEPPLTLTGIFAMLTYSGLNALIIILLRYTRNSELSAVEHAQRAQIAEQESRQQNALLNGLSESVLDGILIVSAEGKTLFANEQFKKMWKFPPEVLESRSDEQALNWAETQVAEPSTFRAGVAQAYTSGKGPIRGELKMKDGRVFDRFGAPVIHHGIHYGWVWTFRDIADLKRAEAESERQRALLEAILEACPAGIVVADAKGKILRMNQANQRLWGAAPFSEGVYEYREWKGWWADGSERQGEPLAPQDWALARALRGEVAPGDVVEIERFDAPGTRRTMINSGAPVRDRAGEVIGAVVAQIDITERVRAEEALRKANQTLQTTLDSISDGLLVLDHEWRYTYFSETGAKMLGMRVEDLIGRCAWDLFPKAKDTKFYEGFHRAVATGLPVHFEEYYPEPLDKWVECHCYPSTDGLSVYFHDVTERKKGQEILQESEQRYRTLFESIDEGFCIIEMIFDENQKPVDYRFIEINPAFEKHTGLVGAVGKTIRQLTPDQDVSWYEIYGQVATSGASVRFENRASALNRWFDVFAFRVGDPRNARVAVLFSDITARKLAEKGLAQAKIELERHAANLEKTVAERTAQLTETVHELESFSYSLSHDMRAPLRAMRGFSQLLETDFAKDLGEEGSGYVRRISTAAARLDQLIQDVLTYSKVVRESIVLETISVETIARQLIDENPLLQPPRAEIEIKSPLLQMKGHDAYLTQVLSNLLYNAVKFVPEGRTPRIRIWTEPIGSRIRLFVQDNGIGIAPEARNRIFGMFERLHSGQHYEGTGIGLAIVRKAVERMGGKLGVQSALGQGSTFWIELDKPDSA